MMNAYIVKSDSLAETQKLGQALGTLLPAGMVVALIGDLGAGKTTFTQGIAQGMGVSVPVTSPTFTLVNEYDAANGLRLLHIDSYRLGESPEEVEGEAATFGFADMIEAEDVVVVIEWADRLAALLPPDYLAVELQYVAGSATARTLQLRAHGPSSNTLLALFTQNLLNE